MRRFERIERMLPTLLDELTSGPTPDYIDEVLGLTASTSQRPGWTFLHRWIPMTEITYRARLGPSLPLHVLAVVVLILSLLVAAILLAGAERRDDAVNLFGPGLPGVVAFEAEGDIRAGDPATGDVDELVAGPGIDRLPAWSLDGRRLAFVRVVDVGRGALYVLDASGAEPTLVRPHPFALVTGLAWSPDARSVLVSWIRGTRPVVSVVDVKTGATTDVRYERSVTAASFRPPDGRELLFVGGEPGSSDGQGIFAYDLAAGTIRTIVEPVATAIIQGDPAWSPDGTQVAYGISVRHGTAHAFTVAADAGTPRPVPPPRDVVGQGGPVWTHDGQRIALVRWYVDRTVVAIVEPRTGGPGIEVQVPTRTHAADRRPPRNLVASLAWAPDDSRLIVRPLLTSGVPSAQLLIDPWSGSTLPLAWDTTSEPAWQRLTP